MRASDICTVAVIGAGTMGSGIAGLFARAGCEVRLVDLSAELLQDAMDRLRRAQEALIQEDLLSPEEAAAAVERIRPLTSLAEACAGVQFLVEAVPENLTLKQEMFDRFDELSPAEAVFVSNTSGLSITELAGATHRPDLVAGMHFWNPPHVIPLVEVTEGPHTSDATATLVLDMCRRIGKRPILVRHDVPGFVGNRLQFAVLREALHILSEGIASAEDIDAAMTAGPGFRYCLLGPLRTADLGGLDVFLAISEYLFPQLNNDTQPPAVLRALVKNSRLGAKSGGGFYDYSPEDLNRIISQRDRLLLRLAKLLTTEESR